MFTSARHAARTFVPAQEEKIHVPVVMTKIARVLL